MDLLKQIHHAPIVSDRYIRKVRFLKQTLSGYMLFDIKLY